MKQQITEEQLGELSDKGKERLLDWYHAHDEKVQWDEFKWSNVQELPILNIGQMIESLEEDGLEIKRLHVGDDELPFGWYIESPTIHKKYNFICDDELCDALWEAVKEVLEKE